MSGGMARAWTRSATTTYPVALACAPAAGGNYDDALAAVAAAAAAKSEMSRAAAAGGNPARLGYITDTAECVTALGDHVRVGDVHLFTNAVQESEVGFDCFPVVYPVQQHKLNAVDP
jgi:hypothetical protein